MSNRSTSFTCLTKQSKRYKNTSAFRVFNQLLHLIFGDVNLYCYLYLKKPYTFNRITQLPSDHKH